MILKPVKVGVIGCEGYSMQWIKRLLSVPDFAEVVAVTAVDLNSLGAAYCRRHALPVLGNLTELFQVEEIEVIVNPTPIHLHQAVTVQCLKAGFPVWLEKPAVATVQSYDELRNFAETSGTSIPVCFNSLYSKLTQDLKRELVSGKYGQIRRIKGIGAWIRTRSYFERNDWAGCLQKNGQWILDGDVNNALAHVLCDNLFLAGAEQAALADLREVEAELYRCNDIESEDTSCARVITKQGIEILSYLTLATPCEIAPRTVIEADKAQIIFEDFKHIKIIFLDGSVEEREAYQEHRIEMIAHLCRAFRLGEKYIGELSGLRPFTEAVNGIFDSSGHVHSIPRQYVDLRTQGESRRFSVVGLHEVMEQAFASNMLFSEMGVPWARRGEKIRMDNYGSFPQRFESGGWIEQDVRMGASRGKASAQR